MYDTLATWAPTIGLIYFMAMFAVVLVYALRPSNKARFDKAAHAPLEED